MASLAPLQAQLASLHAYIPPLLTPVHPHFPFPLIDIFGAMRLSSVVNWMATDAFAPPEPATNGTGTGTGTSEKPSSGKKSVKSKTKPRASVLQECFGILVVVFGGETFLAMCSGTTPYWLVSPKVPLLFSLIHIVQTRTPLRQLLPSRPSLAVELPLAIPDAIGRALLLTRFSIVPLLHAPKPTLPLTPTSLVLTPFILAVPFASIIFSATSFFSPTPKLDTPAELKPWGWTAVDSWLPLVVPALFLSLIGPVNGWPTGLGWSEDAGVIGSVIFTIVAFVARAIYNFGYKKEQWTELFLGAQPKKIKTA